MTPAAVGVRRGLQTRTALGYESALATLEKTRAEALVPCVPQMAGEPFYALRVIGSLNSPARLTRAGWTALAGSGTFLARAFSFWRAASRVMSGRDRLAMLAPLCRYAAPPIAHHRPTVQIWFRCAIHAHPFCVHNFEPRWALPC